MAELKCNKCNAELKKGDKVCEACGAKVKKPLVKRVWFWVLIGVVLIGVIAGTSSGGNSGATSSGNTPAAEQSDAPKQEQRQSEAPKQEQIEYVPIAAGTIFADAEANALKAADNYEGKYFAVSGFLKNIDSDGWYFTIGTKKGDYSTNMLWSLRCSFLGKDDVKAQLMEMATDQEITVYGKITDIGDFYTVTFSLDRVG